MSSTDFFHKLFGDLETLPEIDPEDRIVVRDLMTAYVLAVDVDAALRTAKRAMEKHAIRHVPVVDCGRVIGMLSQRELASAAYIAHHFDADRDAYEEFIESPVRDFLKTRFSAERDVITIGADESIQRAVDVLVQNRLTALPVLGNRGDLVGILSYIDVLNGLRGLFERI
jgi:acetoin utilization protein AcuB